jgi:hypothetical protein
MARRRIVSSVDTSDRLANLVLGSLLIGLVALFGLVAVMSADDEADPQQASASEVPSDVAELATIDPSPTAADEPEGSRDGVVAAPTTVHPDRRDSATPLRPREDRTEAEVPGGDDDTGDVVVVPPPPPPADDAPADDALDPDPPADDAPADDALDPDPPADGAPADDALDPDPPVEDAPADDVVPPDDDDDPSRNGDTSDDGAGHADEPVVPWSGVDDADRVPALVVNDDPTDVHTVLADLDGDNVPERVRAAIVRNAVEVRVERYEGGGLWRDIDNATGAVADDLVGLWVQDLNSDGRAEIHTKQWVGTNGESVSLWSFGNDTLQSMTASGGCWDGSHTFGVVGALVHPGEVKAICEEEPLPPSLWSTAVYRWDDGRWTFQELVGVYPEQ